MSVNRRSTQAAFSLFSFQDIITSITGIMILITLILAVELITRTINAPPMQTAQQIETTDLSVEELEAEILSYRQKLESQNDSLEDLPSLDPGEIEHITKQLQVSTRHLQTENRALRQLKAARQKILELSELQDAQDRVLQEKELAELKQEITDLEQQLADLKDSDRVFFQTGVQGKSIWLVEVTASGFMAAEIGVNRRPTSFFTVSGLTKWLATLDASASALYLTIKPSGVKNFELCKEALDQLRLDVGFQVVGDQQQVIDPQIGAGAP